MKFEIRRPGLFDALCISVGATEKILLKISKIMGSNEIKFWK